ncbi:MAG TPA: CPBP family intramembrane metalloprotease [Leptolyngbyaceae cyanobacterium M65_K2018_010]|nr:CPBP family intramembrane metalloprotease [Leptolyngbyaceae cyanobacterium M65_K2018_010]
MNHLHLRTYIAFRLVGHRLVTAATTLPGWPDWGRALALTTAFSAVVLPLGLLGHWLTLTLAPLSSLGSLKLALRVFLAPALLEEGFWRVLLLPHKTERISDRRRWILALLVLVLFVLMHLFSSFTVYPNGFPTFTQPLFLLSAALLGLVCTLAYWQSGSVWVSVAIHWVVVFTWLMFFGGYGQLQLT